MTEFGIEDLPQQFKIAMSMDKIPDGLPCGGCRLLVERESGTKACALVLKFLGEKMPAANSGVNEDEYNGAAEATSGAPSSDIPEDCPVTPVIKNPAAYAPSQRDGDYFLDEGPSGYHPHDY